MILTPQGTIIALSNGAVPGQRPLAYAADYLSDVVSRRQITHLPYAAVRPTDPTQIHETLENFGASGVTTVEDPRHAAEAVRDAEVILVTGGNTFLLLAALQRHGVVAPIQEAVNRGATYMGISAGTNVLSPTIATTNSMPIASPSALGALGLLPVQLNVHYPGPLIDPNHSGESRDDRISEYVHHNNRPVLALREAAWVVKERGRLTLHGAGAREFDPRRPPKDHYAGADLTHLL